MTSALAAAETPIEIHVSPDGNDASPGNAAQPLATLEAAVRRAAEARDTGRDIEILLHDGAFRLTQPIELSTDKLPAGQERLRFVNAPGAKPVVSGGREIQGWKKHEDGSLRATIPEAAAGKWKFRELFVGGERRPRARHPNVGYVTIEKTFPDRRSGFTFRAGDLPEAVGEGAELVFLHDWSISRIQVAKIDHAKRELTAAHPIGSAAPHYVIDHFEPHPRYYLENHRALLDAPGEWFLDEPKGELIYLPREGETPESLAAIAPLATALVRVTGTPEAPATNVHFEGIAFAHCAWHLPPQGYADGQATWHDRRDGSPESNRRDMMPAAIHFELAENCSLHRCTISHLGGSGVWLGSRTRNCVVTFCTLEDISGNTINLGEDTGRHASGKPWWQAVPDEVAQGHIITDNTLRRGGQQFFGAVGIWGGLVREMTIEHNLIEQHPYSGISVGWMWNPTPTPAGANSISHNHIHHVMQILSDGGGIYTLGRQPGTKLIGNFIHDVPLNLGRAESNGMFLDEGTDQIVIAQNVIHRVARSPLRFHKAFAVDVRDNVLILPNAETPAIRYNSTKPETIKQTNNRVEVEAKFDVSSVQELIRTAGPRAEP